MKNLLKNKRFVSLAMLVALMMSVMIVPTFAVDEVVNYETFSTVITALTSQISVSTVVTIIAGVAGTCVGLVFMWWGIRKAISALMSAFKKGRVSL